MTETAPTRWIWIGHAVSSLASLGLTLSAVGKLTHAAPVIEGFGKFGYAEHLLTPIGIIELLCVIVYAVPKTSVLGAILATGYLGGAVATHVRIGDNFVAPLVLGVLVWLGLWLRDPTVKAAIPLRKA